MKKIFTVILSSLLLLSTSCSKPDWLYPIWAEWIYENKTEETVSVMLGRGNFDTETMNFTVAPGDTVAFRTSITSVTEDIELTDYDVTPYSMHGATVTVGNAGPVFYPGRHSKDFKGNLESVCNLDNYKGEKVCPSIFRFRYILEK